jgi:hypothetical protein
LALSNQQIIMVGAAFLGAGSLRLAARPARMMLARNPLACGRRLTTTVASQGVTKDVITAGSGNKPTRGSKVRTALVGIARVAGGSVAYHARRAVAQS